MFALIDLSNLKLPDISTFMEMHSNKIESTFSILINEKETFISHQKEDFVRSFLKMT
jgi:hypothetical protein